MAGWQFWVDRGGTFTDIVAVKPDGTLITHKLLSENPERYANSAVQGIRDLLDLSYEQAIPNKIIDSVKVGTTVATNALLERKGEKTALVTTKGFKDSLKIAYQHRPDIFAQQIILADTLFAAAFEIAERIDVQGNIEQSLNLEQARQLFNQIKQRGFDAIAIVLMHSWINPQHEQALELLAKEAGFTQISLSHKASQTIKLIPRGDTCVADAYLTPVMQNYVNQIADALHGVDLYFMQSNGALTQADLFKGKDAILSGPAGGIVGAVKTAQQSGFNQIIGFDMGGTSTDVSHYADRYEFSYCTEVAGVRLATPMLNIHTVAAGGGSVCQYADGRFQVGPESAGSNPGPACYRKGGPLTVTDCNLVLGKLNAELFPVVFGINGDLPLDKQAAINKLMQVQQALQIDNINLSLVEIAQGFIEVAVDNMAHAVRHISTKRGYDLTEYALSCFGGAGGQHACLMAQALGMNKVIIHPYAGVLSAFGIGLSDQGVGAEFSAQQELSESNLIALARQIQAKQAQFIKQIKQQTAAKNIADDSFVTKAKLLVKYQGAEVRFEVDYANNIQTIQDKFAEQHQNQFGYVQPNTGILIDAYVVEVHLQSQVDLNNTDIQVEPLSNQVQLFESAEFNVYQRDKLSTAQVIQGPALIVEKTGCNVIEAGWQAKQLADKSLLLERVATENATFTQTPAVDTQIEISPIKLEIYNNLFMSFAEQMGEVLARTAHSVNIRERLDFSCAIFNQNGELIANAPHVPVHLGSMSHSVLSVIEQHKYTMQAGDSYLINSPFLGGTHLPDLTLVTPIFYQSTNPVLYVASRAHHADVGGITPGSMPADSNHIQQEGLLFDGLKIAEQGKLLVDHVQQAFAQGEYPARNIKQNIADLSAQLAANKVGEKALIEFVETQGLVACNQILNAILANGELAVRNALQSLNSGTAQLTMDCGATICVDIKISGDSAIIDFSGTSEQQNSNFNAPRSITDAAVIYVFRCLVENAIPLNAGCMRPLTVVVPEKSMLNPEYPAAVVAGNVEVSQAVVSSLFLALGKQACSQTTMNNLSFGNAEYQYYETLAGGTGAGITPQGVVYAGQDAVHSHMTNSRLTDPEILEQRYPVKLRQFAIRANSGGKGQFNGGNGLIRSIEFLQPMQINILANSRLHAPQGLAGGSNGLVGCNYLTRLDTQDKVELSFNANVAVDAGDILTIETPGGGGFGQR
ncbi:hydantoinase B/oxoprolinase family protein [Catenovulum agarivorans]|uniref:hydantoinase B/oxoprolinase family protein n=1 Tax=Catenovulum agarivorans TaxID=1172192 RepID=UPI00031AB29F|nr:hydantoinase B/oxoprolinase family protein [Catenovulum agarivorans]